MATNYPTGIDTTTRFPQTVEDDTDSKSGADLGTSTTVGFLATWMRDMGDAMRAVQNELGIDPSGSFATVRAREDSNLTVRKTADQTFSSTVTPANITDLAFALSSGIAYTFEFTLLYRSAATANGQRLALTTPAFTAFGAAVRIYGRANEAGGAGAAGAVPTFATLPVYDGKIIASGGQVASDGVVAANTDYIAIINGVIIPSAAGNLQVQAANEVSTANGNVIRVGSSGRLLVG